MKNSKKAQGLSIQTIIILVIALLSLVVIAVFFLGGFEQTGTAVSETSSSVTDIITPQKITDDLTEIEGFWKGDDDEGTP